MEEIEGHSTSVSVSSFVAARAREITSLSLQIAASTALSNKGLVFQHVPKHMRRRAVSHNVKRLPKRLQKLHVKQRIKSNGNNNPGKKPKKPSRKYRRRKSNLLLEYNRRQKQFKWLETHVWHAKRFHMDSKWEHKIPIAPCDKGYRAIYRSFQHYSAMQDISFYSCLEIRGPRILICEKFRRITSPAVDILGIGAKMFTIAHREGHVHIYGADSYPYGYIGEISFFWVSECVLWIWVHPGYKTEVRDELIDIFDLCLEFKTHHSSQLENQKSSLDKIKLEPKQIGNQPRWSSADYQIILEDLEGNLNRIRLCGEKTFFILKNMLHPISETKNSHSSWFNDFFKENDDDVLKLQHLIWSQTTSSQDFPSNIIIPLVVRDPRMFLPQKRTKYQDDDNNTQTIMETEQDFGELLDKYLQIAPYPICDAKLRERIIDEKISDTKLSNRRSQLLIPGSELKLQEENQVPVLLIRQPGDGWDLILPPSWCMAFWISFSYRAVRVFGLRDAIHHAFEFDSVHSPILLSPDSFCGHQEEENEASQNRDKFNRYPPAKRPNLILHKCAFPFHVDWKMLLNFWRPNYSTDEEEISSFYILRDVKALESLRNASQELNIKDPFNCLIGVKITIVGKGKPSALSVICIPENEEEIQKSTVLVEPFQNSEDLKQKRKNLFQTHQKQLAFLRAKRKAIRRKQEAGTLRNDNLEEFDSKDLCLKYNQEVESLFLPQPEYTLKSMSRIPFGFVTLAGESYSLGRCAAFGYVSLLGLQKFQDTVKSWKVNDVVLVRDSFNTLEYRKAKLEISLP